jgi:hypothetical protein
VAFGSPETIAPPGPNGPPALGVDPGSGRALAAWVTLAGEPQVEYSLREPAPAAPGATRAGSYLPWPAIALLAGGSLAFGVALRRSAFRRLI